MLSASKRSRLRLRLDSLVLCCCLQAEEMARMKKENDKKAKAERRRLREMGAILSACHPCNLPGRMHGVRLAFATKRLLCTAGLSLRACSVERLLVER